ncbi:hypothetical protein [Viscerimonas tarda]
MIVKLTKDQFDYLNCSLSEQREILEFPLKEEGSFVFIEVDNDRADKIRDWAMDEQLRIGFDINYELTIEGKILEGIIDAFFQG